MMPSTAHLQQVLKCLVRKYLRRNTDAGLLHLQKAAYVTSSSSSLTSAFNSKPRKLNINFSLATENTVIHLLVACYGQVKLLKL